MDDFGGLSPNQMNYLFYEPFDKNSSLQFSNALNDEVLDQIPFFRITEALVHIVKREKKLKLTATGALPVKICEELYSHKFLTDELIEKGISKLIREDKCISIGCSSVVAQNSGLVKKVAGKLLLTKLGMRLLMPQNRLELFYCVFLTFAQKFNWAYNDHYSEYAVAQLGWAYSVYLLIEFGNEERNIDFYAEKYLQAFPDFIGCFPKTYHHTTKEMFLQCYGVRTLDRFFEWFGFVSIKIPKKFLERTSCTFTSSEILNKVFVFD